MQGYATESHARRNTNLQCSVSLEHSARTASKQSILGTLFDAVHLEVVFSERGHSGLESGGPVLRLVELLGEGLIAVLQLAVLHRLLQKLLLHLVPQLLQCCDLQHTYCSC